MDKQENILNNYNHSISLYEKKNLTITGVKKIVNFDDCQFLLDTVLGFLMVKGDSLELLKLDTLQGNVSIKGNINNLDYIDEEKKKNKDDTIFARLFK